MSIDGAWDAGGIKVACSRSTMIVVASTKVGAVQVAFL
jgi:hypothetical protein